MGKIKIVIVGGGNISNTRHIPALKKNKDVEIIGVLSNNRSSAEDTAKRYKIKNFAIGIEARSDLAKISKLNWLKETDAVVIGTPPMTHYGLAKYMLDLNKHVLVEKPMTMTEKEAKELTSLAKKKNKVLYVMHNFQYADKMLRLNSIIESKRYGEIVSINELQFTNRDRRLPVWYNDLPGGLFYDEAAHFVYLLEKHAGRIKVLDACAQYTKGDKATPTLLSVSVLAGKVPVQMFLNFNSPVCEWLYIVNFKKRICVYDFFKDILIDLPTDNEHMAKDVLRNSTKHWSQYWSQFIGNGAKMVRGNLLYGHDMEFNLFVDDIKTGKRNPATNGEAGRSVVVAMNEIIRKMEKK